MYLYLIIDQNYNNVNTNNNNTEKEDEKMSNKKIRRQIADAGLRHWQIADFIGISPSTLTIWLRHELTGERLARVEAAVAQLSREAGVQQNA